MKLPDFLQDQPLNRLRQQMGAELGRFRPARSPSRLSPEEIDLLAGAGIEVSLDDIRILDDGTLAYKDSRVALCPSHVVQYDDRELPRHQLPSFHLADCGALQELRAAKPQQRYIASTREDGSFGLHFLLKDGRQLDFRRETLGVCLLCLGRLCWHDFHQSLSAKDAHAVAAKFSLREFFNAYRKALPGRSEKLDAARRRR